MDEYIIISNVGTSVEISFLCTFCIFFSHFWSLEERDVVSVEEMDIDVVNGV